MKSNSLEQTNWLQRGKLLGQLGLLEIALDCFEQAIISQNNREQAQYEKYLVLKELGKEPNLVHV